jgi:hypothetical protein
MHMHTLMHSASHYINITEYTDAYSLHMQSYDRFLK